MERTDNDDCKSNDRMTVEAALRMQVVTLFEELHKSQEVSSIMADDINRKSKAIKTCHEMLTLAIEDMASDHKKRIISAYRDTLTAHIEGLLWTPK